MTAELIAEALGLQENQKCLYEGLTFIGKASYWMYENRVLEDEKSLIAWLSSPEGEKVVRDRVRKLAGDEPVVYIYDHNMPVDKRHRVDIGYTPSDYCGLTSTEAEVWLAALEFLHERKGK